MAHGLPDYGRTSGVTTTYPLTDLGELAARLGSIVTYDRRGEVVWFDDFEDNIAKWGAANVGTGASAELSTEAARSGGKSCKLVTPSDTLTYNEILHGIGVLADSKVSLEVSFADQDDDTILDIIMQDRDGVTNKQGVLRYRSSTGALQIFDGSTMAYITLATLSLPSELYIWHTAKLVIDMSTNKYVRALLNNRSFDLSAYSLYSTGDASAARIEPAIRLTRSVSSNLHIYLDDVIVTQNEP